MTGTFFALLVCSVSISFVLLLFHNSDGITALCFSHKHRILPITPGMGKNKQLRSRTKIVGTLNASAVFSLPALPLSLPMLFIAIQWPNRVYQHWGDEKTQKCPCVLIYWRCPAKNSANGISESPNLTIFWGSVPPDPRTMDCLHLYNFSPHVHTPLDSLHQYETRV